MAAIYQAACSACDYTSLKQSDGYLAVILDRPSPLTHAHPEDRRVVILAHPVESMILSEMGVSFRTTCHEGRLLYVREVMCRSCGTMYEIRRLGAGGSALGGRGWLSILAIAMLVGALVGQQQNSIIFGLIAGCLASLSLSAIIERIVCRSIRRRYPRRVAEFDRGPGCPKCGGQEYAGFRSGWRKLVCPGCGRRSVRIRYVAKS